VFRRLLVVSIATLAVAKSAAIGQTYVGTILYPIVSVTQPYFGSGFYSFGNQTVGYQSPNNSTNEYATLWTSEGTVDLSPTTIGTITQSVAFRSDGAHQVGYGYQDPLGSDNQALLWSGTASSVVNLNPASAGFSVSVAAGISGTQQVGYGSGIATKNNTHALVWTGSAASYRDLNPTNLSYLTNSFAENTDGANQVGYGTGPSTGKQKRALLWSGTANSAVDLTPTDIPFINGAVALAVSGNQQVGFGAYTAGGITLPNVDHALVWNGTADTAIDLNPTVFGAVASEALGTNGAQEAGWADVTASGNNEAL
jgi:hypothetical protein